MRLTVKRQGAVQVRAAGAQRGIGGSMRVADEASGSLHVYLRARAITHARMHARAHTHTFLYCCSLREHLRMFAHQYDRDVSNGPAGPGDTAATNRIFPRLDCCPPKARLRHPLAAALSQALSVEIKRGQYSNAPAERSGGPPDETHGAKVT